MNDDAFKLGNFGGLNDGDELPVMSRPEAGSRLGSGEVIPLEDFTPGVIKHPTEKSDPQAKFRHPHNNKPLLEVDVENIVPNEYQPRRIFNTEKLQELAESIKVHGIIQPMVVVEREDGKYEIVVGERRFRASKLAGLTKVPVFVNPKLDSQTKLELALIENVQRADLNPIEEAKAYERLQGEFGLSTREIGARVGKDYSTVSNLIRLLNLPVEIQRALVEEKINEGQARPLLSLRDHAEMLEMFKIVVAQSMKVRDIENKVREIRKRRIKVSEMFTPDPFLSSLENVLRSKLGTRVEVNKGAKGGKITIEFFSDEELSDIVNRIS